MTASHLVVAPVLLPLATAAILLLLGIGSERRWLGSALNLASTIAGLAIAVMLALQVHGGGGISAAGVYLPGNWMAPFGIVLVADRLSVLMLVLAGCVGLASLLYALPRWQHAGVYFHPLFQLQLMGLYGAFLTADLFNLFVFFEVLLAASYGLLLHGGGKARVRASLHYVAMNLVASLLFLVGIAILYGVTGTLNMADIARRLPMVPASDRGLMHAGAAILGVAFLTKAAMWPLNFWLPGAYSSASAPVAALFVILTKVGVYAVLRLWTLCFPPGAGDSALFGGPALVWGGMATVAFGSIGMMASQQPVRIACFSVIVSSGTLIAAFGFGSPALSGAALFYLASSTLAGCSLFLLVELLERTRQVSAGPPRIDDGRQALPSFVDAEPPDDINLDDNEQALTGRALPAALAFLGVAFTICALVIAGLPPLSGFVGKIAMLAPLPGLERTAAWTLFGLLILSGFLAATALVRVGIRYFWSPQGRPAPRVGVMETLPIGLLLAAALALVVHGDLFLRHARATADALHSPARYIDTVMTARPVGRPQERRP